MRELLSKGLVSDKTGQVCITPKLTVDFAVTKVVSAATKVEPLLSLSASGASSLPLSLARSLVKKNEDHKSSPEGCTGVCALDANGGPSLTRVELHSGDT